MTNVANIASTSEQPRSPRTFLRPKKDNSSNISIQTYQVRIRQVKDGHELGFKTAEIKYQNYPEFDRRVKNIEEVSQYFANGRWETPRVTRLVNGGRVPRNSNNAYLTIREFVMGDVRKHQRRYSGVNQGDNQFDISDMAYEK
jgi:hypothetical protein